MAIAELPTGRIPRLTATFNWSGPQVPSTVSVILDRLEEYTEPAMWTEDVTSIMTKDEYLTLVYTLIDRALEVLDDLA